jgi:hypothetical protein
MKGWIFISLRSGLQGKKYLVSHFLGSLVTRWLRWKGSDLAPSEEEQAHCRTYSIRKSSLTIQNELSSKLRYIGLGSIDPRAAVPWNSNFEVACKTRGLADSNATVPRRTILSCYVAMLRPFKMFLFFARKLKGFLHCDDGKDLFEI